MAEMKDAHVVVEIPVDDEHQQKLISAMNTFSAIQHHPLMEISQSPGHLLLLKLWQREEDLFGRRISMKETRLDTIRREIFQLCCFFCIFHTLFLTILFTSYSEDHHQVCHQWWIPSLLSLCTSIVIVFLVQMKLFRYWKVTNQLQRERNDNRTLTRCIQELRMKGASFDLSKEPQNGKRMKSSSVEIKWKPLTWLSQYLITICLVCFTDPCHYQVHLVEMKEFERGGEDAQESLGRCFTFYIIKTVIMLHLVPIPSLKGMKRLGPKVTQNAQSIAIKLLKAYTCFDQLKLLYVQTLLISLKRFMTTQLHHTLHLIFLGEQFGCQVSGLHSSTVEPDTRA